MAYFLKKSNLKKGTYLQIYESFYDPDRKQTVHKSYKAIGYVHELEAGGLTDPVSFYKAEVEKLNLKRKEELNMKKMKQISDETPEKYLGYFLLKSLNDSLGTSADINLLQLHSGFDFSIYSLISSLIYSRTVRPCSKYRTFEQVIPKLFEKCDFSLHQLYSGLEYIGSEYEKIIEIYNAKINEHFPFSTSHTYFDCTNFYFEIDREDNLRRKGPSKENRRDPIVGLGLLLDANQIPIGMKIYPGNESEKPVLRSVIDGLKQRSNITGRTIQVADKGLNCAENIFHAVKAGDGYIFSKSVKSLPQTEKDWVLLPSGYHDVTDNDGNLLYRIKECTDAFPYLVPQNDGSKKQIKLDEKRIVTYNPSLAEKQRFEINKQVAKARQLKAGQAKRDEYGDSAKYVTFSTTDKKGKETDGKVKVSINEEKIATDLKLCGYNLIVTSELNMTAREIYSAYHNLWRIEESFRVMKSQLDARPVYVQKQDSITGHFLICYLAVLLIRLLQFKILDQEYCSEEMLDMIRDFRIVKTSERKYVNVTKNSRIIQGITQKTGLPLTSFYLTDSQVKSILQYRFQLPDLH